MDSEMVFTTYGALAVGIVLFAVVSKTRVLAWRKRLAWRQSLPVFVTTRAVLFVVIRSAVVYKRNAHAWTCSGSTRGIFQKYPTTVACSACAVAVVILAVKCFTLVFTRIYGGVSWGLWWYLVV